MKMIKILLICLYTMIAGCATADNIINQHIGTKKVIAVIGDSGSAEEPLDGPAWPTRLNQLVNSYGMDDYEVKSFAVGGASFKNLRDVRPYDDSTKNQIDKVIEVNPAYILVMLGANDLIPGNDASQAFSYIDSIFTELKTELPDAKIVYLHEQFCDYDHFDPSTLKNKGIFPMWFKLRTTGYLANTYNSDMLEDPASDAAKGMCVNTNSMLSYIQSLSTVDYVRVLDLYKLARVSGISPDGLHPNYFGQGILTMMVVSSLKDVIPEMMHPPYDIDRSNITNLVNALLISQGDGYIEKDDWLAPNYLETRSLYEVNPAQWYLPKKTRVSHANRISLDTGVLLATFSNAYPNTNIELSIDESDFSVFGKTNDVGEGMVFFPLYNMNPLPPLQTYRLRWKIGNVVLGPYPVELY